MYSTILAFLADLDGRGYKKKTIQMYDAHLRSYYSYCRQTSIGYVSAKAKDMKAYKKVLSKVGYSPSTINARFSALRTFYDYLIDIDKIIYNPVGRSLFIRVSRNDPKPVTEEEETLIFEMLQSKEEYIRLAFEIMFDVGLRVSEVANLGINDVKLAGNIVTLNIKNAKRNKSRILPIINKNVAIEVLNYAKEMQAEGGSGPLFHVSARDLQYHAQDIARRLNIKFTCHMCRHTFATKQLHFGTRIDIIQKFLGHENISTTMLYAKTLGIDILALGAKLNDTEIKG